LRVDEIATARRPSKRNLFANQSQPSINSHSPIISEHFNASSDVAADSRVSQRRMACCRRLRSIP